MSVNRETVCERVWATHFEIATAMDHFVATRSEASIALGQHAFHAKKE